MATKTKSTAPYYKILHAAVGQNYQGDIVQFGDDIDTDRLLGLGAIELTTERPQSDDEARSAKQVSGSDTASFEAGVAAAAGVAPTGPAANPENVQAAKDAANK